MQFIKELFSVNEILTVSIMSWFVAQVLKTIINFILLGKFQLERMWGDGGMPSAHSATVCAMVIAAARSEGVSSAIFAVASVVAIITMHDAMGVRHETGEQAKVLNYVMPVLALVLFWNVYQAFSGKTLALNVEYDGQNIGYVGILFPAI